MNEPALSNDGGASLPNATAFAAMPGSPTPLPDSLDGIYARWGRWEKYSEAEGYRKRPCMIRLTGGGERGPCWPNAGKFCLLEDYWTHWPEAEVVAVCYAETAEESESS